MTSAGFRLRASNPRYNIHPVDQPRHRKVEESISRTPDIITEVYGVAILAAIFGGLIGWSMNGGSIQSGIAAAGIIGLATVIVQTWRLFGAPVILENTTEFQKADIVMDTRRGIPIVRGNEQIGEVHLREPKKLRNNAYEYEFSGRQLDRLLKWLEEGTDTIRRERSGELPGFNELDPPITGSTYTNVRQLLKDAKLIDDSNQWTREGEVWLRTI